MAERRVFKYTTEIPARRSAQECVDLLAEAGADRVTVIYTDRQPTGLAFRLDFAGGWHDFTMPIEVDGTAVQVRKMLVANPPHVSRATMDTYASRAHCADVAWRVVRDWIEAQLAIIAAGAASLDQVMLPYLEIEPGRTLYDRYVETRGQLALGPGGDQ